MTGKWLFKTEPSTYSYERLVQEKRATWDGIANPVALKHLSAVKAGDTIFIYHTGAEKQIVGLARAAGDAYPDSKGGGPRAFVVDIVPERALPRPVTLAAIKQDPRFQEFALVRQPRLSVMPVPDDVFADLLKLGPGRRDAK